MLVNSASEEIIGENRKEKVVIIKKDFIELRKSGKFYNSFGEDAIILHYLLGYKIVAEKGGIGFPETAYNKVINILENEKISYKVYEKDIITEDKNYKKLNTYKSTLKKGISELSLEERFSKIEKRLKKMNNKELDHVLEIIENAILH